MTDELRNEVFKLNDHGHGPNEIARRLGIHPHSVRWVLRNREMNQRERQKRRERGQAEYRCGKCKKYGHNRRTCGRD
jgi:DNA invertase Pin-like site-specific DNA recombinase